MVEAPPSADAPKPSDSDSEAVSRPIEDCSNQQCKYCGSKIYKSASFCGICEHYVSPWRNSLKYWSSVVGLFAAIVAASAFALDSAAPFYNSLVDSRKVEILYFQSGISPDVAYAVSNFSQGDVFLKDITIFFSDRNGNVTYTANKIIKAGSIITTNYDLESYFTDGSRGYLFFSNKDANVIQFISQVASLPRKDSNRDNVCFERIFFEPGNSNVDRMIEWAGRQNLMLATQKDVAQLRYYNIDDKSVQSNEVEILSVITRPRSYTKFLKCLDDIRKGDAAPRDI